MIKMTKTTVYRVETRNEGSYIVEGSLQDTFAFMHRHGYVGAISRGTQVAYRDNGRNGRTVCHWGDWEPLYA